jgi:hypothetical protein
MRLISHARLPQLAHRNRSMVSATVPSAAQSGQRRGRAGAAKKIGGMARPATVAESAGSVMRASENARWAIPGAAAVPLM